MKKEEVLKFYQKYRLYIFPITVSLSALVLIAFVIFPQTEKLITNQKASEKTLKKLDFLQSKVSALEGYNEEDLNLKVNSALYSYPVDKDFVSVTGLLQNLSAQAGFGIVSLNLGSTGNQGVAQSYDIKLEISGPVAGMATLLASIESSPRLMRVTSVETTVGRDSTSSIIALGIEILYAPPPQDFGTIDSPLPELTQKDEEVLAKLARVGSTRVQQEEIPSSQLPARGRENPFE